MSYALKISREDDDRRLDRFLRSQFKNVALSEIMRAIRKGAIRVNASRVRDPGVHVFDGDELLVPWALDSRDESADFTDFAAKKFARKFSDLGNVGIIYKSENVLILNKPAGILVQPDVAGGDSIVTRAVSLFGRAFAVHRLDRNTTGAIALALHGDSSRALIELFRERSVKKYYAAIVAGEIKNRYEFEINAPLKKDSQNNIVKVDLTDGLPAITLCRKLTGDSQYSLVMLELVTGRTHQARVHMSHVGHPIIGDRKYGLFNAKTDKKIKRPLLHAYEISFPDDLPPSIAELEGKIFRAPLPADMQEFIKLRAWDIEL